MSITKKAGRREPSAAIQSFTFANMVTATGEDSVIMPENSVLANGLFVLDTLFNSATSDAFVIGDAGEPDRYGTVLASQAFTAANTDLLTTTDDFAAVRAVQVASTPAAPGGLVSGTTYYAINIDSTHIKLSATLSGAAIDITSAGTGNFTLKDVSTVPTFTDETFINTAITPTGGTADQILVGQDITTNTKLLFTVSTDLPSPLVAGTTYYVSRQSTTTMKLLDAPGGTIIDITDAGTGTHHVYPVQVALVPTGLKVTVPTSIQITWTGAGAAPSAGAGRLIVKYNEENREDYTQR